MFKLKKSKKFIRAGFFIIALGLIFSVTAAAIVAADLNLDYSGVSSLIETESLSEDSESVDSSNGTIDSEDMGDSLENNKILSPALNILSKNLELKKSALLNADILFKAEDFERVLGIKLQSLVITSLPDIKHGVLTLAGNEVLPGQKILRENIKYLRLVPYPDRIGEIQFYFKNSNDENVNNNLNILCTVNTLESLNFAPNASEININTQKNISVYKKLIASDPESDKLEYRIIQAPKKGILEVRSDGGFVYKPANNYTGSDKFVYQVYDIYGNFSNEAAVNIKVVKPASSVIFADMSEHWAANSAVKAVGAGFIDVSANINLQTNFEPNAPISRAEFLEMSMRAAKLDKSVKKLGDVIKTDFADDSDIPAKYKAYVKAAFDSKIIFGIRTETGIYFDPNGIISRAEAAVILNNILRLSSEINVNSSIKFSDFALIPNWAIDAVNSLSAVGIMRGDPQGNFNPNDLLNKAQSAEMLCNMLDYQKSLKKSWWQKLFGK